MRRVCLNMVHELARRDSRVVYLGSDPSPGTLDAMRTEFADRCLIEGIAEGNVIGMAAGLAFEGLIPFVNTIATFITRRCYDQIAVDLCLHDLPVRLIGNGAGLVYAPLGPTHQAIEDIAIMRALPNMSVVAPCDADEMRRLMECTPDWPGPLYIRLAKGGDTVVSRDADGFAIGRAIVLREPGEVVFVATGIMVQRALAAADLLGGAGVVNMHTVKPFDVETLVGAVSEAGLIVTLEEHSRIGGLGSAVMEGLAGAGVVPPRPVLSLGIPDTFTSRYGSQDSLLAHYGLDAAGIVEATRRALTRGTR